MIGSRWEDLESELLTISVLEEDDSVSTLSHAKQFRFGISKQCSEYDVLKLIFDHLLGLA